MKVIIYDPGTDFAKLLLEPLSQGFRSQGDTVRITPSADFQGVLRDHHMAVFIGLEDPDIEKAYRRLGKHTLLLDEGYFYPEKYFRFALDGFQSHHMRAGKVPKSDRLYSILSEAGIKLRAPILDAERRQRLLYVGPTQEYCNWHKLEWAHDFDAGAIRKIVAGFQKQGLSVEWWHEWPDDTIFYMPRHTTLKSAKRPLQAYINDARVVVTHGGNAAVGALLAGVPLATFSKAGTCAGEHLAQRKLDNAWQIKAYSAPQQLDALSRLAWGQFTLEEIASGFATDTLTPYTYKHLEKGQDPNDLTHLTQQYEIMHAAGKFRGGLDEDLIEAITRLVKDHKATTLLDYGSGKGRQYGDELNNHQNWGILPKCYDPGYEPFAKKPTGTFDGVICTDVAEHIPPDKVQWFLKDVADYANKFVMFCISTVPAAKHLPDARNCHLSVHGPDWWTARIAASLARGMPSDITRLSETHHIIKNDGREVVAIYRTSEEE